MIIGPLVVKKRVFTNQLNPSRVFVSTMKKYRTLSIQAFSPGVFHRGTHLEKILVHFLDASEIRTDIPAAVK